MPEKINRTIPNLEDLIEYVDGNWLVSEPETRFLGKTIDELQTTGQRLDFLELAEAEAHELNAVIPLAQVLLAEHSFLTDEEKLDLSSIISGTFSDVTIEEMVDTTLKYGALQEERKR